MATAPPAPKDAIRARALELDFDAVGFAPARASGTVRAGLSLYLAEGRHGDMGWMATTAHRRADPRTLWPGARSAVVVGLNYGPERDPLAVLGQPDKGAVSAYAQTRRDYHDVVKKKLRQLARWMAETWACEVKLFVDTAPLMEKPLAQQAGVGWQGKHSNLVSRRHGSWLFLGEVLTSLDLPPDAPEPDRCGSCRRCLDACPTDAFPAPYRLDARRCIAYLTIEHQGHIPREFRAAIGNRVFGCDDCLAVCPWNKFARTAREAQMQAREELASPALSDLAALDDAAFRALFAGSPIKRLGRDRMVRNVLIAMGNSGDPAFRPQIESCLADASALVRAMAVWALSQLLRPTDLAVLAAQHRADEADPAVRREWALACGGAIGEDCQEPVTS
ncbi:MAG: tRNA epoxyqueuosine(34) reductase QueG [Alphaproteobacteria bacterium]|nr:tRNA epoxyqueuosine(34) reductase QueG [Alphaproteobacteria bacterium]MCB9930012.1 tRNA epoxyqueuosine(34) reductase QueG [Alphaproteobacteria bacterium]